MIAPVPPDIVDEESSSDTLANEGMRVLMNCKARGNPAPVISWKRQDEKPMRLCNSGAQAGSVTAEPECKEGTAFVLNNINGFFFYIFLPNLKFWSTTVPSWNSHRSAATTPASTTASPPTGSRQPSARGSGST